MLKAKVDDATSAHEKLLERLQAEYEESEKGLGELKKEVAPRIKMLRAATAPPAGSADKDEV